LSTPSGYYITNSIRDKIEIVEKLSVVINTLNEEKNLPRAIASIRNIADEIVVVDMFSDDKTVEIAKNSGARLYTHKKTNYVEPARNYAISKASNEWILVLDADEEIPPSLAGKIKSILKAGKADYYRLPRKNIIFGRWIRHSRWWPDYNIRLFRKGFVSWNEIIHSIPITKGKGEDLQGDEKFAIIHHNYNSIEEYVDRLNRYTTLHSKLLIKTGYKFSWKDIIEKPFAEFLGRYFSGEGYKDGFHGLSLSFLQAFSELVLYLKIWQENKFKAQELPVEEVIKSFKQNQKELNYWTADTLAKKGGNLSHIIKRKFKLP
jgi:(heptosyl)LPS beta-1,4-glucosyltransferase